jgi:hypothetical protein
MALHEQRADAIQSPAASLLPARHPRLRDTAIFLANISTICYFIFSEGVRGFLSFIMKILIRFEHIFGVIGQ